jgi:hypothetical protein
MDSHCLTARPDMSTIDTRHEQMFPKLTPREIDRLRRFGEIRHYEALFVTGDVAPAAVAVMSAAAISRPTDMPQNLFAPPSTRSSRPMIPRKGGAGVTSTECCSIFRSGRRRIWVPFPDIIEAPHDQRAAYRLPALRLDQSGAARTAARGWQLWILRSSRAGVPERSSSWTARTNARRRLRRIFVTDHRFVPRRQLSMGIKTIWRTQHW